MEESTPQTPAEGDAAAPPRGEAQLIRSARRGPGREAAFASLVERHAAWLHRYLAGLLGSREDAQDCAQEALFRAWCALPDLRTDAPEAFRAFLRTVATRVAFNFRRREGARKRTAAGQPAAAWQSSDEDAVLQANALLVYLAQLPHIHREVLMLRYFEELTVKEIAELLDLGTSATKMRLKRARAALRRVVEEDDGR